MSDFIPKKVYLQGILLHYFIQKKSAAEALRILVETYANHALLEATCRDWFRHFKNNDFDVEDKKHSSAPKKFENEEFEDSCQSLVELAESLGVDYTTVQMFENIRNDSKQGHWVLVEAERRRRAFYHVNSCFSDRKGKVFCILS